MGEHRKPSHPAAGPAQRARRPRRAPAAALSRERIVATALELVSDETLAALSTRRLAQRLGCEAMSIYHHFPGKRHLIDALVDHAIATIEWPSPLLEPVARLRAVMHAYRAMAHRFPQLYPLVAIHRLNTPTGVAFIESALEVTAGVVPDPELAARHFRTIGYYLMGACLDETAGYATGPSAAEPVSDAYIAERCPRLAQAAPYFQRKHWDRTFELGVEALLEAAAEDGKPTRRGRA
jgi:AcrR family transcriptional regulator